MDLDFMRQLHGDMRWLVVAATLVVLAKYVIGWLGNGSYRPIDRTLMTVFNAVLGLQLLLGLIMLVWVLVVDGSVYGIGVAITHAIIMIAAVGIGGMAAARARRQTTDRHKFQTGSIGVLVATALIVIGVQLVRGWAI